MAEVDEPPKMMHFMSKDPSAPLRFLPPETPPPFEARSLLLKQIDTRTLDERSRRVMSLFSFAHDNWVKNNAGWIEECKAATASISPQGSEYEITTDERANRRFSGDSYLSSTRYYSICRDANGNDGGTMERELTAYHDPFGQEILEVHDLTNQLSKAGRPTGLLLFISPFTSTRHEWLQESARQWATTEILLPINIMEVSFERVIDLRVPYVAEWFTRHLTRLVWLNDEDAETLAMPLKPPLDCFVDLLPSLLIQDLGGGNGTTRIAGQWLRSLGTEALVFPSARSDSFVEVQGRKVIDSYGWNVVDYREARPSRMRSFDLTAEWLQGIAGEIDEAPLAIYADVRLQTVNQGSRKGSWMVQNLEEMLSAHRKLVSAVSLYKWAWGEISADQMRQLNAMLGLTQPAAVLGQQSGYFIRAVQGDASARRAVLEAASESLLAEDFRRIDLPGTFQRVDARVAAWGGTSDDAGKVNPV